MSLYLYYGYFCGYNVYLIVTLSNIKETNNIKLPIGNIPGFHKIKKSIALRMLTIILNCGTVSSFSKNVQNSPNYRDQATYLILLVFIFQQPRQGDNDETYDNEKFSERFKSAGLRDRVVSIRT